MFQRDFLMRELKRMLDGIAAVLRKHREGDTSMALQALGGLYDDVLAEHRALLDHTDARTMASILASKERVAAVASLLAAEAELKADDPVESMLKKAKATELMLEAIAQGYDGAEQIEAWAVPESMLSPRARELRAAPAE
ncbi:MAG: hypothetical protein RIT81_37130 [Deltaproteobacteria bacterium]